MRTDYYKFFSKLAIFFLPFVVLIFIELFILPIDKFTFRFYETLKVGYYDTEIRGPFYPNHKLDKIEQGDLAPNTNYSVKRHIFTCIDNYGFRKCTDKRKYDVVIIGDSFIWGSNLSQEEMLSEVLEKKTGLSVYPYAPSDVNLFLKDKRFIEDPPKIVIINSVERYFCDLPKIRDDFYRFDYKPSYNIWQEFNELQKVAVTLDRIRDSRMYNFTRKRIFSIISSRLYVKRSKMLFLQGEAANKPVSESDKKKYISVVKQYNDYFKKRGIHFIFLPIPNKENIYYKDLNGSDNPPLINAMITDLQRANIRVANLQSKFKMAYEQKGIQLYHTDDSHWNINGVTIAAEELDSIIKSYKNE
jgi:alginate O-acetyltransferase complex protein AlgJ